MSHIPTIPDGLIIATELPGKHPFLDRPKLHAGVYAEDGENRAYVTAQLAHLEEPHAWRYNSFVLRKVVRRLLELCPDTELAAFEREVHDWDI